VRISANTTEYAIAAGADYARYAAYR